MKPKEMPYAKAASMAARFPRVYDFNVDTNICISTEPSLGFTIAFDVHAMQADEPAPTVYIFTPHDSQVLISVAALAFVKVPDEHNVHADRAPGALLQDPDGHGKLCVKFPFALYDAL